MAYIYDSVFGLITLWDEIVLDTLWAIENAVQVNCLVQPCDLRILSFQLCSYGGGRGFVLSSCPDTRILLASVVFTIHVD